MKPIEELGLGWQTHLIFARFDAQVIEQPACLVVRTPQSPSYWWGNFLLFYHAPRPDQGAEWLASFETHIGNVQPESRHIAIGIDSSDDFEMPTALVEAGVARHAAVVLTMRADQLRTPRHRADPEVRVQALDPVQHSAALLDLQVATDGGQSAPAPGYRRFREREMARYAAMERAGLGHWFGAFVQTANGEQLVADCGLFSNGGPGRGATLGRFQQVGTHPSWRRRGLCTALIHAVCRHGFDMMGLSTLVIVADPDDVAIHLYESLGFQRGESHWQLERKPAD